MSRFMTVMATLIFVSACSPPAKPSSEEGVPARQPGQLTMQPLDSALRSYYQYSSALEDSARLIVRDNASWSALWARIVANHGPTPAVPSVDFAHDMLIVAAMGTRATGGFSIRIASVEETASELVVTVVSTSPGRTCGTTSALTAPVDIVRIPRSDRPARFVEQQAVNDCG